MEYKFRFLIDNEMHHLSLGELIYGFTPNGFLYPEKFAGVSTGLFDKNQNEIYTGDIVKCHDHPTGILDTTGEVKSKHGHYQVNGNPLHDYGTSWTNIIGSIYTNPELLNAK